MNKVKSIKHDFHLKENSIIIEVFDNISISLQISRSELLNRILEHSSTLMDMERFKSASKDSNYNFVINNIDSLSFPSKNLSHIVTSLHIYMPEKMYKKLKILHQELNTYSNAGIVREMFRHFLSLYAIYGNCVFDYLTELSKKWNKKKLIWKQQKKNLRQLFDIKNLNPHISVVYNINFEIISIKLL